LIVRMPRSRFETRETFPHRPSASDGSPDSELSANRRTETAAGAAAIMAALSVDKTAWGRLCAGRAVGFGGETGTQFAVGRHAAGDENAARTRDSAAAKVFFIRSPTTACWKLATRSRICCGQRRELLLWFAEGGRKCRSFDSLSTPATKTCRRGPVRLAQDDSFVDTASE